MSALVDKYESRGLVVLGFPCNQFGHQENSKNEEILSVLKHVRPGNGYEPNFPLSVKVEVNGSGEDPLFSWLKSSIPIPHDEQPLCGAREGSSSSNFLMNDGGSIGWKPVRRCDIAWNFEKFLIAPDGLPFRRYSRFFETAEIATDIEALLELKESVSWK